jgi:succinate dehydrogenase flavin-adding protein (antitoxin of CptAB toxin-antitoxin module)
MQDELTAAIAADLGIKDLPQEQQQALISQFGEIALKAATFAIIEKLSESAREEFKKLAEAGDSDALQAFLNREVPEHEALAKAAVAEEVKRFKDFQKP